MSRSQLLPGINNALANLKFVQGASNVVFDAKTGANDIWLCMEADGRIFVIPAIDHAHAKDAKCVVQLTPEQLGMLDITKISVIKLLYTQLTDTINWLKDCKRSECSDARVRVMMRNKLVRYVGDEDLLR